MRICESFYSYIEQINNDKPVLTRGFGLKLSVLPILNKRKINFDKVIEVSDVVADSIIKNSIFEMIIFFFALFVAELHAHASVAPYLRKSGKF